MIASRIRAFDPLSPRWLRSASLLLVGSLHAAIFSLGILWPSPVPASLGSIEVAIEGQGSATADQAAGAGDAVDISASAAAMAPPKQTNAEAKTDTSLAAEPPDPIETASLAEARSPDLETPPAPKAEQPESRPREVKQPPRPRKTPPRKAATKRIAAATHAVSGDGENTMASDQGGRGNSGGATQSGGRSRASYAALVVAQIQAHKFYPPSARSQGLTGAVAFTLAIGPDGSVIRFGLTRSSGSPVLDQAARQIVHAIRLPPPPGGSFIGASSLNFNLSR